jgi:hypothetical protein
MIRSVNCNDVERESKAKVKGNILKFARETRENHETP